MRGGYEYSIMLEGYFFESVNYKDTENRVKVNNLYEDKVRIREEEVELWLPCIVLFVKGFIMVATLYINI